ncbi:CLH domain-containing protein [Melittangium boletus]|uniref:DEAD/DEAH box helicase n=1 Tax=Melittangium boletus DSM 14713 TaxID=1294270 RepID=A0A250IMN2_9BACT|nr:CLH domain-containing protein [Melittangium boletus]ATB32427.1 DEAD/DEAH box helicase [Melittangium boletus DSM 14713]
MGPGQRIIAELSGLEKALGKGDLVGEKQPLEAIVRSLRSLRVKSLDELELNVKGRLMTTLLRVQRQTKPAQPEAPSEAAPSAAAEGAEAPAAQEAPPAAAEGAEAPAASEAPAPAAPAVDPAKEKFQAYGDVLYLVGRAWRAAGDAERSSAAFALSGRSVEPEREEPAAARPASERPEGERRERRERPEGERRERRERPEGERRERRERPEGERRERRERPEGERRPQPELTGDWQEQVKQLEGMGRTRDAARMHERNNSFAEATRLFEAGGDLKSALRTALAGKDNDAARRLTATVPPEQLAQVLEKAGAYELLMEIYIGKGDFENVARLYERARQFDQAALAYERAGKLSLARKAYERSRDFAAANRIRDLEVKALVERGDRLGAATLLVTAGRRQDAVEVLGSLPPPKAFHFLQRLKLDEEAKALAQKELARAEAENKPAGRARWLELLGESATAAALYEEIGRKEKALGLFELIGHLPKAAALAEELQLRDRAIALYTKLGDNAGVERSQSLPATPPAKRPADAAAAAEEAEETGGAETPVAGQSSSAPATDGQESQ